ncbi:MAG: hypothetical protein ACR650_10105 [Methylocystis sp.]
MTKPDFAKSIGMSGSQFRYVRARAANPSIEMLARISAKLKTPLYELLEDCQLGHRRNLSGKQMAKNLSVILKGKYLESGLDKEQFAKSIGVSLPQLYLMLRGGLEPVATRCRRDCETIRHRNVGAPRSGADSGKRPYG